MDKQAQEVQDFFGFNIEIVPLEKKTVTRRKRKASGKKVTAPQSQYADYWMLKNRKTRGGYKTLYIIYTSQTIHIYSNKEDAQIRAARLDRPISKMRAQGHSIRTQPGQYVYTYGCRVSKVQSVLTGGHLIHIVDIAKRTLHHIVPVAYTVDTLEYHARRIEKREGRLTLHTLTENQNNVGHILDTMGVQHTREELNLFSAALHLAFPVATQHMENAVEYDRIIHRKRTRKASNLIGPRGIGHPSHNNPNKRTRKSSRLIGV